MLESKIKIAICDKHFSSHFLIFGLVCVLEQQKTVNPRDCLVLIVSVVLFLHTFRYIFKVIYVLIGYLVCIL